MEELINNLNRQIDTGMDGKKLIDLLRNQEECDSKIHCLFFLGGSPIIFLLSYKQTMFQNKGAKIRRKQIIHLNPGRK